MGTRSILPVVWMGVFLAVGAGCADHPAAPPEAPITCAALALGDSYTVGESIPPTGAWPRQLADSLAVRDDSLAIEVIAATGWRTDDLLAALRDQHPAGPFAVVFLMIGVNDQYQGFDADHYSAYMDTLLTEAARLVPFADRLLVFSIPDYGVTPVGGLFGGEAISTDIDAFNLRGQALAVARGHRWLDVTDRSRLAADDPALVARDGLHFSAAMYSLWVQDMLPEVSALLPGSCRIDQGMYPSMSTPWGR